MRAVPRSPRGLCVALFLLALPAPSALASPSAALASPSAALDAAARLPAKQVELAPAQDGTLGAWLVVGPYPSASHEEKTPSRDALTSPPPALGPAGADEAALTPQSPVAGKRWALLSAAEGPIDVKAGLHARGTDLVAYAVGTLHVEHPGRYVLLVGADDGVRVVVDGKSVFERDESRPQRDDDDLVPLDLTAGDHAVVLKLHQRDSGWAFKVRLLDHTLSPPEGAYLALPGTTAEDARALAAKLSWVSVDRGLTEGAHDGTYRPRLLVRFPAGAPRGVPLRTTLELVSKGDAARHALMKLDVGEVPLDARGVGELDALLPAVDITLGSAADFSYDVTVAGRMVKAAWSPRRAIADAVHHASSALKSLPADAATRVPCPRGTLAHWFNPRQ